ncbi:MAG: 4-hydroxy-tetrahydrodipicolinate reductase [Bacteroidota bacterium]|jgi:4-hydroxy-tetrahydrodipicolinate reductase
MKIALIGYGTMGKAIESRALALGHEVVLRVDKSSGPEWKSEIRNADVAIEFTQPEAAVENILICFENNVPVVTGTTGWYEHFHEICDRCLDMNQSLFHATNFSIGVNVFFQLNRHLARLMATQEAYSATMEEIHHIRKKDAPSGTAITLAEGIIAEHPAYDSWRLADAPETAGDLPIKAIRTDDVPGTHRISYRSTIDDITITHTAFNREGFAQGAVRAAEFLHGKKGVYSMSDLLNFSTPHGL